MSPLPTYMGCPQNQNIWKPCLKNVFPIQKGKMCMSQYPFWIIQQQKFTSKQGLIVPLFKRSFPLLFLLSFPVFSSCSHPVGDSYGRRAMYWVQFGSGGHQYRVALPIVKRHILVFVSGIFLRGTPVQSNLANCQKTHYCICVSHLSKGDTSKE